MHPLLKTSYPAAEVRAIGHLRQWAHDRCRLRYGRTQQYLDTPGRAHCRTRVNYDAAIVRVLDFERAMATLPTLDQLVLVWRYRDGHSKVDTARLARCSVSSLHTHETAARRRLAIALDRMGDL